MLEPDVKPCAFCGEPSMAACALCGAAVCDEHLVVVNGQLRCVNCKGKMSC